MIGDISMKLTIGKALQQGMAAHKEGNLQDAERFLMRHYRYLKLLSKPIQG